LEQGESQRLETLADIPWAFSPCANHPFDGWLWFNEDTPFIIASRLMECDKPKDLPPFVIEYITALYGIEISEGNHHAMNNLGAHYYGGGRGSEQSFSKAMELYNMAAENGNRQAQENLGYCLLLWPGY